MSRVERRVEAQEKSKTKSSCTCRMWVAWGNLGVIGGPRGTPSHWLAEHQRSVTALLCHRDLVVPRLIGQAVKPYYELITTMGCAECVMIMMAGSYVELSCGCGCPTFHPSVNALIRTLVVPVWWGLLLLPSYGSVSDDNRARRV